MVYSWNWILYGGENEWITVICVHMNEFQHTFDWKIVKVIYMVRLNMYNVQNQEQLNNILLQDTNTIQAREKSKGMSTTKFKRMDNWNKGVWLRRVNRGLLMYW